MLANKLVEAAQTAPFNERAFEALNLKVMGWTKWSDERHDAGKTMVNRIQNKRKREADPTKQTSEGGGRGGGRGRGGSRGKQART